MTQVLYDASIFRVQYSSWTATNRSTLQTLIVGATDFIEELCNKLTILKPYSFVTKQQSQFIVDRKNNLSEGEVAVGFDFSENLKYVMQDASQAFHFNNEQCTAFPVVYYYKEGAEIQHKSCVFLSESVKHDTASVYTIQTKLIPEIKSNVGNLRKVIYMTDGAKQHFKNRFQIANLVNHENDFGVETEWHITAIAHGKSGYDGIGATFKREAYRASLLAKPSEAILTSQALFSWAQKHFKTIKVFYFSKVEYDKMVRKLNRRFQTAIPIPDISKNHSFTVLSEETLLIKRYSNAPQGVSISLKEIK